MYEKLGYAKTEPFGDYSEDPMGAKDGERCTFRDHRGRRCKETGMLELHHIKPFAKGGPSTTDNITVYCRAHNQHAAERDFGPQQLSLARVRI